MIAVLMLLASGVPWLITQDEQQAANAITAAITTCLSQSPGRPSATSTAIPIPPGLIEGVQVSVAPIAGSPNAFGWEGTNPHVITCGVAIYGPVSRELLRQVAALISRNPAWEPHPTSAYDISKTFPKTKELYWGDPLAPSLTGVALLYRNPRADAPTIEIEYHSVLVQ